MFNDLREQADSAPFDEEEPERKPYRPPRPFLGMSAAQRFVVAAMLFFITCVLGVLLLLATQRVVIPGLMG